MIRMQSSCGPRHAYGPSLDPAPRRWSGRGSAAEAGGEARELSAVHVGDERVAEPARLPHPHVEAARVCRQRTPRLGPGEVVDAADDEEGDGVEAPAVDGRAGSAVEEVLGGAAAQGELGVTREGDDRRKVEMAREPWAKLM